MYSANLYRIQTCAEVVAGTWPHRHVSAQDVKQALHTLTARYGTDDALRTSRYQHQGYPASFNVGGGLLAAGCRGLGTGLLDA